jgi:hypothetical protein
LKALRFRASRVGTLDGERAPASKRHYPSETIMNYLARDSAVTALAILCGISSAQNVDLSGTYEARFEGPDGGPRTAIVVIKPDGATWKVNGGTRNANKCVGKETPASVDDVGPDRFTLHVYGSKMLVGCPDSNWTFKRVDANTYESKIGGGRPVTLTKQ